MLWGARPHLWHMDGWLCLVKMSFGSWTISSQRHLMSVGPFSSGSRGCLLQDSCCYSSFQATKVQKVKVNNTYYGHGRPWKAPFTKRSTFQGSPYMSTTENRKWVWILTDTLLATRRFQMLQELIRRLHHSAQCLWVSAFLFSLYSDLCTRESALGQWQRNVEGSGDRAPRLHTGPRTCKESCTNWIVFQSQFCHLSVHCDRTQCTCTHDRTQPSAALSQEQHDTGLSSIYI